MNNTNTKTKENLLFVSIAFPPKNDPESLQVAKYFKYLKMNNRFNIDVLTTPNPTLFMPVDVTLNSYLQGYRQLIECDFFENKYLNYVLRKFFPRMINRPDSKYRFQKNWMKAVQEIKVRPDIIYSRSFPLSSTVMAYHLSVYFDVPWVMHLSDPWCYSALHSIEPAKAWNLEMERCCLHRASLIALTSYKTIELYANKYPEVKDKLFFSPNVYETNHAKVIPWKKGTKLKLVYTGGLIGNRSPDSLLTALKELDKSRPEVVRDLDVVFAGSLDRKNAAYFSVETISVRHIGSLSYAAAVELQNSADLLILIDLHFANVEDAVFFPSKLLDYMVAGRRVLAITDQDSASLRMIEESKMGDCVQHADIDRIMRLLLNAWHAWCDDRRGYFEINSLDTRYSAEFNAEKLSDEMLRLCHEQ